ncbi:bile acid:sodium symporter family protein [Treponema sp. TIM-1]|uniref:bile acid:sodium symporter family protein n=1 Tax=Treponema sp. TIM-1 TaxID=2898417 RepID=UPI00397F315E
MSRNQTFVESASAVNQLLNRLMPLLIPCGVLAGILFSRVFILLRPLVPWLFGVMTLSGAIKLRARDLGRAVTDPKPVLLFFLFTHGLMPGVVFLLSRLVFSGSPDIVSGYVLLFSIPTAVSGFIWVSMYGGDPALSLTIILLDTLCAPLIVPGTVTLLLGTSLILDMTGITISLFFMVVFPTIIGVLLNETSRGKIPRIISPYVSPISKLCLTLVVAANTSAIADQVRLQEPIFWLVGISCVILTALGFIGANLAGLIGRLSPAKRTTLFFAAGLRNISASATLAIEFFPEAAALPAILGMLCQQILAALLGNMLVGKQKKNL